MLDVKINKISRDVHNLGQRSNSSDLEQISKKQDDDTKNKMVVHHLMDQFSFPPDISITEHLVLILTKSHNGSCSYV